MNSLPNITILINKQKDIKTGFVQNAAKNSKYLIKVGNITISAFSTSDLSIGQRVTIGKSTDGWVVLNFKNVFTPTVTKIKIRG